jgi:uncharacterized protein YcfL
MKDTVEIQSFELTSSVSSELISSQEAISSSASDTSWLFKKKNKKLHLEYKFKDMHITCGLYWHTNTSLSNTILERIQS